VPVELRSNSILAKMHTAAGFGQADTVTPGIYAMVATSGYTTAFVYAYPDPDTSNGPPVCSIGPVKSTRGLAIDRKGDLLVGTRSGSRTSTVTIYKGPGLCGPELGSIANPYGNYPTDVASRDAQNGRIVVGNESGIVHRRAGVTVCTLSGGCTANLMAPTLYNVASVAIAPNGDCWATGWNGIEYILFYFAQCRHRGVIATGYQAGRASTALDIDGNGNLVTIGGYGDSPSSLYIYSGCNPSCKLVGGPFQLQGSSRGGHLDASSKQFVAADSQYDQLDIYSYSTSGIKYEYSINNGLPPSATVTGAAFSPSSKE
jgi:hypothetical protein